MGLTNTRGLQRHFYLSSRKWINGTCYILIRTLLYISIIFSCSLLIPSSMVFPTLSSLPLEAFMLDIATSVEFSQKREVCPVINCHMYSFFLTFPSVVYLSSVIVQISLLHTQLGIIKAPRSQRSGQFKKKKNKFPAQGWQCRITATEITTLDAKKL